MKTKVCFMITIRLGITRFFKNIFKINPYSTQVLLALAYSEKLKSDLIVSGIMINGFAIEKIIPTINGKDIKYDI